MAPRARYPARMTTLLALLVAPAAVALPEDPAACFREVASALAADEMDGRGVGTPGLDRAAGYLAATMKSAGERDTDVYPTRWKP
jgi:hypothetical protein